MVSKQIPLCIPIIIILQQHAIGLAASLLSSLPLPTFLERKNSQKIDNGGCHIPS